MYNNEVTYAEKWETEENKEALKKLEDKFFNRSICYPSCPTGWAPEVLELLEYLDSEFGIARNTCTFRSYHIQGAAFEHFIKQPISNFFSSIKDYFITEHQEDYMKRIYNKSFLYKIKAVLSSTFHPVQYGFKALKYRYLHPLLNRLNKPKITLDQIKEKYGRLELYYSAPSYLDDHIDELIIKTKIKLAMKGCYYPLESMWGYKQSWHCGTEYSPDTYEVTSGTDYEGKPYINVEKTMCRKIMKDMGLDLKDIELKYNEYISKKDEDNG